MPRKRGSQSAGRANPTASENAVPVFVPLAPLLRGEGGSDFRQRMTGEGLLLRALATKKPLTHQTLLENLRRPLPARAGRGHNNARRAFSEVGSELILAPDPGQAERAPS